MNTLKFIKTKSFITTLIIFTFANFAPISASVDIQKATEVANTFSSLLELAKQCKALQDKGDNLIFNNPDAAKRSYEQILSIQQEFGQKLASFIENAASVDFDQLYTLMKAALDTRRNSLQFLLQRQAEYLQAKNAYSVVITNARNMIKAVSEEIANQDKSLGQAFADINENANQ